MSTLPPDEDPDLIAAEYVLGLLEGEALADARLRAASDPEFAQRVSDWEERLMPLFDGVPEASPNPELWERISRAIAALPDSGANVIGMRRKLNLWRGYAAGATAIAASLALVIGYQSVRDQPVAVQPAQAPLLVAALSSEGAETSLSVTFDPDTQSLLISPTRITGAPGHEHELWLLPAGGKPISLGLVRTATAHRLPIRPELAPRFDASASIALSVEPVGGSPTGQPTGPVVASGALSAV